MRTWGLILERFPLLLTFPPCIHAPCQSLSLPSPHHATTLRPKCVVSSHRNEFPIVWERYVNFSLGAPPATGPSARGTAGPLSAARGGNRVRDSICISHMDRFPVRIALLKHNFISKNLHHQCYPVMKISCTLLREWRTWSKFFHSIIGRTLRVIITFISYKHYF